MSLVFCIMQMEALHVCHRQEFVNNRKAYVNATVVREKIQDIKLYIEKQLSILLISDIIASVYRTFLEEYIGAVTL